MRAAGILVFCVFCSILSTGFTKSQNRPHVTQCPFLLINGCRLYQSLVSLFWVYFLRKPLSFLMEFDFCHHFPRCKAMQLVASGKEVELTSTNMRAAGILVFCVFCCILSTVTSLRCEKCVSFGSGCPEGTVRVATCKKKETFCSTTIFNSTIDNLFDVDVIILKECSKPKDCLLDRLSTTTVEGRFQNLRRICCQSDLCNAEQFDLARYETRELSTRRLQCPGCFALDADYCEANQTVNCAGEEDQCLTLTGSTLTFNFAAKYTYQGCTTKNTCSHPIGPSLETGGIIVYNVTKVECRNATFAEPDDDQ
ncbi:phospholipase A2 inhibitor and Ly6/PLAUR domain-containing protein-like [Erythrolamprus reginae]|uniref:phospholipase A2 inhibitor and Ly6/PLAUR domain-containing protein-like n=1 Tax=Erythrolamprus reginae TaxID=121349 RepID=UPI00396CA73E